MCYYVCIGCAKNLGQIKSDDGDGPFMVAVNCFCSEKVPSACKTCKARKPCEACGCNLMCPSSCTKKTWPDPFRNRASNKRHLNW